MKYEGYWGKNRHRGKCKITYWLIKFNLKNIQRTSYSFSMNFNFSLNYYIYCILKKLQQICISSVNPHLNFDFYAYFLSIFTLCYVLFTYKFKYLLINILFLNINLNYVDVIFEIKYISSNKYNISDWFWLLTYDLW